MSDNRDPAAQVHHFGNHTVLLKGDVLTVCYHGPFTLAEAQDFTAHVDGLTAVHGPLYTVLDMRAATGPTPEARAWIGRWGKHAQIRGTAVFGASAMMRIILTLMTNATRLMFRRTPPIGFCGDESEALAWVAKQRSKPRGPS